MCVCECMGVWCGYVHGVVSERESVKRCVSRGFQFIIEARVCVCKQNFDGKLIRLSREILYCRMYAKCVEQHGSTDECNN